MKSVHTDRYRLMLEKLRAARIEAGFTQAEVAEELGYPQSFVSKCESGERRIDAVELEWFAGMYGKTLSYFLPQREAKLEADS